MFRKQAKGWIIIAIALCVGLIVSVVFNVINGVKLSGLKTDYASLSDNYEAIGREMLAEKNGARNLQKALDEVTEENEQLKQNVSEYSKALELAYKNIYLSENHYLSGNDVNILSVAGDNDILVDSSIYYALYAGSSEVTVSFYKDGETLGIKSYESGSSNFIKLPENCEMIDVSHSDAVLVSTGIKTSDNTYEEGKYFYVVSEASPVNLSIAEAVSILKEHGTVLVFPGEYVENIATRDKEVNICGVDKDLCVITSYDNDYYNPVLEISAGSVKNLSLKACDDGRGLGSGPMAYAVHADFDYMYGRNLSFENCAIYSDYNAGAGIGLRGDGVLSFVNCDLTGYYHGLFVHDSKETDVGGVQNLVVDSCNVTGINGDVAMVISSCVTDSAEVNLLFRDNNLSNLYSPDSENLFAAVNEDLSVHEGFYMNLKNFYLDSLSSGNNIEDMNY